jgi:hypothetical protein
MFLHDEFSQRQVRDREGVHRSHFVRPAAAVRADAFSFGAIIEGTRASDAGGDRRGGHGGLGKSHYPLSSPSRHPPGGGAIGTPIVTLAAAAALRSRFPVWQVGSCRSCRFCPAWLVARGKDGRRNVALEVYGGLCAGASLHLQFFASG